MTWRTVGSISPIDEALEYCMGGMTEYDGYGDGIHGDGCGDGIGEGGTLEDLGGGGGEHHGFGDGYGWEDGDGSSRK
jgi:hypothetical protein